MSEENFEDTTEDLKLAEKILELTTYIQGISTKLESLSKTVEKLEKKFQDFDLQLGKKFSKIDERFTTSQDFQSKQGEEIQELKNSISDNSEKLDLNMQEIENISTELSQEIEKSSTELTQSVEKKSNELSESIGLVQQEFKIDLEEQNKNLNQNIQDQERKLAEDISTLSEQLQLKTKNVTNVLDILGTGMEQLGEVTKEHTDSLNEIRDSIQNFKDKLQEIVSLSKKDQQAHFENFSHILESFNENIRTELTLTTQNLKESDIDILNEVSEHYTRKKVGEELQESFSNLSKQLQTQTTKTTEDLTHNLQKSVKGYEILIEEQSENIQNYKEELGRIQGEIQAVIDRKVNEKYEAVFSLLATVALHTEELMMLIKTAEIQIPKEVKVMVKEIPKEVKVMVKEIPKEVEEEE
jgi:methyl-accepting chemotaxis protein